MSMAAVAVKAHRRGSAVTWIDAPASSTATKRCTPLSRQLVGHSSDRSDIDPCRPVAARNALPDFLFHRGKDLHDPLLPLIEIGEQYGLFLR